MDAYLWWVIAGIGLVIAELATGTFYLLVIAVGAFAGAAAAYFQQTQWISAVLAAALAACGVIVFSRYSAPRTASTGGSLDIGQTAVFESWVSEKEQLARVRYRNSTWEARVMEPVAIEAGRLLHIRAVDGNTLQVSVSAA
jgi:membrane protein implicated in regulation of membrane protease activity